MRFTVINYLGGELTLNVDKITKKRAKLEFFKKINGRFEDFLFHFFLEY